LEVGKYVLVDQQRRQTQVVQDRFKYIMALLTFLWRSLHCYVGIQPAGGVKGKGSEASPLGGIPQNMSRIEIVIHTIEACKEGLFGAQLKLLTSLRSNIMIMTPSSRWAASSVVGRF